MLHHNAKSHVANMNFIDSILFWYAEQFNTFTVLWLIMSAFPIHWFVHLPSIFISHWFKAVESKNIIHTNFSPCSHNGSNVKSPLYCSIFGRDKRGLISGRPCSREEIYLAFCQKQDTSIAQSLSQPNATTGTRLRQVDLACCRTRLFLLHPSKTEIWNLLLQISACFHTIFLET